MQQSRFGKVLVLVALGALSVDAAQAFNFGNMMNPSRWWGGDNDRRDDDYYGAPPYGYGYPAPGYAQPGYGAPGYAAPGYAQPGYVQPGYAPPAYPAQGYGYAAPAYTAPAVSAPAAAPAPAPAGTAPAKGEDEAEVARLRERVRALEAAKAAGAAGAVSPYDRDYHFPDSAPEAPAAAAAGGALPQYPVYSPYGPPADFPPPLPDSEATPVDVGTVAAPPVTAVRETSAVEGAGSSLPPPAETQGNAANFSPYGNPATYVPPMQDTGQRVYEFGR